MTREDREAYQWVRERLAAGEAEQAAAELESLALRYPGYADVQYLLGISRERRSDLDGAARCLERALELNPAYAEAGLALQSVYEQRGEHERARSLALRLQEATAARGDPTTRGKLANLHAALGDAYRETGDLREAIDAYRRALDRCPGFHDIRQRLAVTLREAGLPARALAELQRVLRANPAYLDAQVQIGLTLYTLGRPDEARAQWEAALERDPSRDDARMYLRLLRVRRADDSSGDAEREGATPLPESPAPVPESAAGGDA
jgi:tetratricopeptide (TPR) repeat protein